MRWRWFAREFRRGRRMAAWFTINLILGLTGFLCLDAFKSSLALSLEANAKGFLAADLALTVRRQLTSAEVDQAQKIIGPKATYGRLWEFFSMIATGQGSRLVQVKATDSTYPLYGSLKLGSGRQIDQAAAKEITTEFKAWVHPDLLRQLQLKVGDSISLGNQKFLIADTVVEDSSQTFRIAALAPRIFVGLEQVKQASLIGFGSTMSDALLIQTPLAQDARELKARLEKVIVDPAVRIVTSAEAGDESGKPLQYLSDYLGLVSLVALFLAGLGAAFLYQNHLHQQTQNMAVFNALGLPKWSVQRLYLIQIVILGLVASALSILAAYFALPVLAGVLKSLVPFDIPMHLTMKTVGVALVLGTIESMVVTLPFVRALHRVETQQLLVEGGRFRAGLEGRDTLFFIPAAVLFWLLAIWQANSYKVGSSFVALFAAASVGLLMLGWFALFGLSLIRRLKIWYVKQAVLAVHRRRAPALIAFVSLALGAMLMNVLPQVKVSLKQDLTRPENMKLPSLFLFDIQDEQIEPLQKLVTESHSELQNLSPLIRARILSVNGAAYERSQPGQGFVSREDEEESRFRNRGVNISYRASISEAEQIVAGEALPKTMIPANGPAGLSVEMRFAERMGLKLGDSIHFDIQGVEVHGRILNLRSVKWNSFQPNFFILIQPGFVDDAPKSWLASLPAISGQGLNKLQDAIVRDFANISMVDVSQLVERILGLADRMSWSLELMASLSLLAGFAMLFSMASQQVRARRSELNLMKILGASANGLLKYLLLEFVTIATLACLCGIFLSVGMSYLASRLLFEGTYTFNLGWPGLSLLVIVSMSALLTWLAARNVIRERPQEILRSVAH